MPDGWEVSYGLNPLIDDAGGDLDNDGLSNGQEENYGTSPISDDTDGDHMNDYVEIWGGFDPTDWDENNNYISDNMEDFDGDGLTNAGELCGFKDINCDGIQDEDPESGEVDTYTSNPYDTNSDDDYFTDYMEIMFFGSDPMDPDDPFQGGGPWQP